MCVRECECVHVFLCFIGKLKYVRACLYHYMAASFSVKYHLVLGIFKCIKHTKLNHHSFFSLQSLLILKEARWAVIISAAFTDVYRICALSVCVCVRELSSSDNSSKDSRLIRKEQQKEKSTPTLRAPLSGRILLIYFFLTSFVKKETATAFKPWN